MKNKKLIEYFCIFVPATSGDFAAYLGLVLIPSLCVCFFLFLSVFTTELRLASGNRAVMLHRRKFSSSVKPEVHTYCNVARRGRRYTKDKIHTIRYTKNCKIKKLCKIHKNLVKIGHAVLDICSRTDKHTDTLITILCHSYLGRNITL